MLVMEQLNTTADLTNYVLFCWTFTKIHSHWLSRPQTLVKAMLMHSVNIPGEEEKHHWARRCGSHVRRDLHDSSLLPFHAWVTSSVSCYPKPMWWAHVPEGQSFTFSASYIVWPEMNRQGILAGDGVILPKGERELLVGYFRISWGFVGIPYGFVICSSGE